MTYGSSSGFPLTETFLSRTSDRVAGHADDALHEVGVGLQRIAEDDDVAALHVPDRDETRHRIRGLRSVDELVDDDVIADLEVVFHRSRRDLERLKDEDAGEVDEDDGDQERFVVLADRRFFLGLIGGH